MISYEIKRKRPEPPAPPADNEGGTIFQRIARRRVQQQNPQLTGPINLHNQPLERTGHPVGMGKIQYTKWLTEMVYPKFPKGTLVTLYSQPFVPSQPPAVWFTVSDYQELHYVATYDRSTGQPKCIAITNEKFGNAFPVYYPPALLRVLQPEEIQAIDRLRNKESERRDVPPARLDGTEESVDRSTGESS